MIVQLDTDYPQPRRIDRIVDHLQSGGLAAYPTDTIYGLGCDSDHHDAIVELRRLVSNFKEAPEHTPLSLLCEGLSQVAQYAFVDDESHRLLRRLLPGPYTFILQATKDVPTVMRKQRETIGIRVPDHDVLQRMLDRLGRPIITTSATTRDDEQIADPWTIEDLYGHVVELVVDGGYVDPGPSTVIDLSGERPTLIREGKGSLEGLDFLEVVDDEEPKMG